MGNGAIIVDSYRRGSARDFRMVGLWPCCPTAPGGTHPVRDSGNTWGVALLPGPLEGLNSTGTAQSVASLVQKAIDQAQQLS